MLGFHVRQETERAFMIPAAQPFPLPRKLSPALASAYRHWKALIRAENTMPFSDDISLLRHGKFSTNLLLIDVFSKPQRFRFNHLGEKTIAKFGVDITGKFADELALREPLNYFLAQASATVEVAAPTFYSSSPPRPKRTRRGGYSRILLPAWGNGRVDLLLGAIG
jgi:hypothetical protein